MTSKKTHNSKKGIAIPASALAAAVGLMVMCAAPANAGLKMPKNILAAGKVLSGLNNSDANIIRESRRLAAQADLRAAAPNHPLSQRLAGLTEGLEVVNGFELNYKVVLDRSMNAFALPSGDVRINSGLMEALTDDELVFAIGHEVGHVFLEHGKKQKRRFGLLNTVIKGAALAGVGGDTITAGSAALSLAAAGSSRAAESDADKVGMGLLKLTGRDLNAAISCAEKLAALAPAQDIVGSFFATHPDAMVRAQTMRELITENLRSKQEPKAVGITLEAFGD